MTDGDLDSLETLDREATPGVWEAGDASVGVAGTDWGVGYPSSDGTIASLDDGEYIENTKAKADADLIAAMRNALPALIADSRALAAYRTREQQARALVAGIRALVEEAEADESARGDEAAWPPYVDATKVLAIVDDLEAIYAKEAAS